MRILGDIATILVFVTFFAAIIRKKYLSNDLREIFLFLTFACITEIISDIYQAYWLKNTMPIGHFYIPISFFILGLSYYRWLKSYINPKIIISIIIVFEVFSVINTLFIQDLMVFANITGALSAIILFVFAVLYFVKVMVEMKIMKLAEDPKIWINTAILIFAAGNFFFFILFNYSLRVSNEFALFTLNVYHSINIFFYLLLIVAMWKTKKASQIVNTI